MDPLKERRTRDDPPVVEGIASGFGIASQTAMRFRPEQPSGGLIVLSAPVFRFGSRSLFRGHQALEFGFNEVAQGSVLLIGNRFEPCFQVGID